MSGRHAQDWRRILMAPRPPRERVVAGALFVCALVSIFTTIGIVAILFIETAGFFSEVSIGQFLGDTEWTPLFADKHFGIWPLVMGTVLTTAIAIFIALPFGLLTAIYLSEFAKPRMRAILKPIIEILAGVPTVVYGYFALLFVTPMLQYLAAEVPVLRDILPDISGFNALSPGIVMGIMIIPTIASLSEDALYAVPMSLREAGYALGGGKVATIFNVVVPAAFSGIAASVILGVSRAVGETMIVTIAAGQMPRFTLDPTTPIATMTAYIVQVGSGETPHGTLEYRTIFVVGACLFLMTLTLNLVAFLLRRRYAKGSL